MLDGDTVQIYQTPLGQVARTCIAYEDNSLVVLSSQETGKYDQEVFFHDVENQDFVNPKSHEEKYSRRTILFRFQ